MHSRADLNRPAPTPPSDAKKVPLIALVGSANSGKTTLFNRLTGSHYNTVNYPGATVEFAIGTGRVFGDLDCRVMDTPGITSLAPASLDEKVTVDALFGAQRPALIIAVVDATQLSRHMYLVRQLQDVGFPLIVALTMTDLLRSGGREISSRKLSEMLECPVMELDPRRKDKAAELGAMAAARVREQISGSKKFPGSEDLAAFQRDLTPDRVQESFTALDELERLVISSVAHSASGHPASASARADANPALTGAAATRRSLDRVLLHPVYGLAVFLAAMFLIFTSIFWMATPFMDGIDAGFGWLIAAVKHLLPASWISDLIADGILGGIGSVMVFLPQILILFFAMGYLEDSGYLARGAALVDKPLSKIGLNGKSFVPLLSGYACAIPAMMAARTIPNRFERNLTIFIIPLMSCSARLPVYTLLLAFLTPHDKPWLGGLMLTGLYLMGLVMGAVVSTVISRIRRAHGFSGFILELPALRKPVFKIVIHSTYHKAVQYLRKAGMTIVFISLALWVLTHTPPVEPPKVSSGMSAEVSAAAGTAAPAAGTAVSASSEYVAVTHSYAAQLGRIIEPVMRPMGLDWRGGVAMICAFAAREVFVSAMVLMYRIDDGSADGKNQGLANRLLARMSEVRFEDSGKKIFTVSSVLGVILFFMIALQCLATVAVSRQESGGWKLPALQLALYTGGAYVLSVALVQGLRALGVA